MDLDSVEVAVDNIQLVAADNNEPVAAHSSEFEVQNNNSSLAAAGNSAHGDDRDVNDAPHHDFHSHNRPIHGRRHPHKIPLSRELQRRITGL